MASFEANQCSDLLTQAQHHVITARQIDLEERQVRQKQEEDRAAFKRLQEEERIRIESERKRTREEMLVKRNEYIEKTKNALLFSDMPSEKKKGKYTTKYYLYLQHLIKYLLSIKVLVVEDVVALVIMYRIPVVIVVVVVVAAMVCHERITIKIKSVQRKRLVENVKRKVDAVEIVTVMRHMKSEAVKREVLRKRWLNVQKRMKVLQTNKRAELFQRQQYRPVNQIAMRKSLKLLAVMKVVVVAVSRTERKLSQMMKVHDHRVHQAEVLDHVRDLVVLDQEAVHGHQNQKVVQGQDRKVALVHVVVLHVVDQDLDQDLVVALEKRANHVAHRVQDLVVDQINYFK